MQCELRVADEYLLPFMGSISHRIKAAHKASSVLTQISGSFSEFCDSYRQLGLVRSPAGGWLLREWIPEAIEVFIYGDFNGWNPSSHQLEPVGYGVWTYEFPENGLSHLCQYRLLVRWSRSSEELKSYVPPYARYAVQVENNVFNACHWDPPAGLKFEFKYDQNIANSGQRPLMIYEAHIGMAGEKEGVSSYDDFRQYVLPRVVRGGYTAIQLMAVAEHAYYGSFGYHVTSFFAPSSRFGTPDDLKRLIDEAHRHGILVLLDLVHSHMSANRIDGIADFGYNRGWERHELWDSELFDYRKVEVLRYLLGNVNYWLSEFHVDGFRFDGVTSMLFKSHGIGQGFSGDYREYFGEQRAQGRGEANDDEPGSLVRDETLVPLGEALDPRTAVFGCISPSNKASLQSPLAGRKLGVSDQMSSIGDGGIVSCLNCSCQICRTSPTDLGACVYLMLANTLIRQRVDERAKQLKLNLASSTELGLPVVSIAEDVSGMPLLCRPVNPFGGFGFSHRLGMAIPDVWIKYLKELRDEDWQMGHLVHSLVNNRKDEPVVHYCESHDQAIVGDKTIAMWLMDDAMYCGMSLVVPPGSSSVRDRVARGIALHKMIRLLSSSLGSSGSLTFMGNEFGHPEWIDFPRAGNSWSYKYARRQWSLADDSSLQYKFLQEFERAMNSRVLMRLLPTMSEMGSASILPATVASQPLFGIDDYHSFDEERKVIAFCRHGLVFVFNFHPCNSYSDYLIPIDFDVESAAKYKDCKAYEVLLSTDDQVFGGTERVAVSQHVYFDHATSKLRVYIPSRTAIVLSGVRA